MSERVPGPFHDLSLTNILVYLSTLGFETASVFVFFFLDFDLDAAVPDAGTASNPAVNSRTQNLENGRM